MSIHLSNVVSLITLQYKFLCIFICVCSFSLWHLNLSLFPSPLNMFPSTRRKKLLWEDDEEEMLRVCNVLSSHLILLLIIWSMI